ncbi:sigma-70 family RNA polymerase sigma factor [Pseudomonas putida]|uniref:Sigma-70 family RNA polymerase sigma factor n=1 Tax=Pseudomonas putida TaxID=303 RepID=A0A8I1EBG3_PSEPU|nr:sigma-70 family RNA polymerase sigma factor [Pseudomonas putida]MBI6882431.1 sigma-70 family RNA polymerase sigma factor [Pseudomonas putida]
MQDAPLSHAKAPKNGQYLENEAVLDLVAKYQATGCRVSLDRLLINFSDLCMAFAHRYRVKFDIEDTYQDAMEFLILAAKKFDPSFGVPFFTFANLEVGRHISMRAIRKWASVTTPGTHGFFKAFRAMGRYKVDQMTHRTASGMASDLGVGIDDVYAAYAIYRDSSYSLNSSIFEDGEDMIDQLPGVDDPESSVIDRDYLEKQAVEFSRRMEKLNPNENRVIHARFLTEKPQTLSDIAGQIGVSTERVRQIESKAKIKLMAA